jgi:hypothetical protein
MPSFNVYAQQNPGNIDVLKSQKYNYGTTPKDPVAEQNQTYMAYFDGVGGTGPEYIDGTAYFIKYLIDTEGNVVNPEPTDTLDNPQSIALYNLINNFEPGKRATVKLITPNPVYDTIPNSEILTGIHNIASVGRIVPILVTETGPAKSDYITTMSFIPPPPPGSPPVANISGLFRRNTSFSASKVNAQIINWQNEIYGNAYTFGGSTITVDTSSFEAGTRIKLKASLGISTPTVGATFNTLKLTINRNTTVPGDNIIANSGYIPIEVASMSNPKVYTVETDWIDASENDVYRVFYDLNGSGTGNTDRIIVGSDDVCVDTYFLIQQENAPYSPESGSGYIDGVNSIYLRGGVFNSIEDHPDQEFSYVFWDVNTAQIYNNSGLIQTLDPASAEFGFSEIKIPFSDVKPGDKIRFEYNKTLQNFTITDIRLYDDSGYTILRMTITPNVGTIQGPNSDVMSNHFCIYRVINDGVYVTLDVKKDAPGGSYTGILQPEFVSQELVDKYDKIITDLTSKEIIN